MRDIRDLKRSLKEFKMTKTLFGLFFVFVVLVTGAFAFTGCNKPVEEEPTIVEIGRASCRERV